MRKCLLLAVLGCGAGLMAGLAPEPAVAAEPERLQRVSNAPTRLLGNSYWGDEERGWFWYEDPLLVEPPKPFVERQPESIKREPPKAKEIVELERLQKRLEDSRKIAIMAPTEANVLRYMELEAKVVRQASYFADVAQRLGWTHSQLDMTLEGRPVNALAIQTYNQQERIAQARTIADLAKDHVIFFFFRGDCPYCHTYAPILKAFAEQNGLTVVPVSLDGGGLPEFPVPRQDNGIAKTLKVDQVPATFLAQPVAGTITPLGFGVLSTSQLSERLTVVMSPQTRGMLPNLTQRLPQQ